MWRTSPSPLREEFHIFRSLMTVDLPTFFVCLSVSFCEIISLPLLPALSIFVEEALFILFSEEIIPDVVVDLLYLWEEMRSLYAAILKCSLQPF